MSVDDCRFTLPWLRNWPPRKTALNSLMVKIAHTDRVKEKLSA